MSEYQITATALAQVEQRLTVQANSAKEAEQLAREKLSDGVWKYQGIDEGTLEFETLPAEKASGKFVKVEYDLNYAGGNYSSVGEFAYIPLELSKHIGTERAFEQTTGYDAVHIVHCSEDELYDMNGNLIET